MTYLLIKALIINYVEKKTTANPAWILLKKGKEWLEGRQS